MMKLLQVARDARKHFPMAPRKARIVQAVRLAAAKLYMVDRGIAATVAGSTFEYASATASVLQ